MEDHEGRGDIIFVCFRHFESIRILYILKNPVNPV